MQYPTKISPVKIVSLYVEFDKLKEIILIKSIM